MRYVRHSMSQGGLPLDLQRRVIGYYQWQHETSRGADELALLRELPQCLFFCDGAAAQLGFDRLTCQVAVCECLQVEFC